MFRPRPTPFAASCFSSYGVTDLAFPLTLQTVQNPGSLSVSPDPVAAAHSHHSHAASHSDIAGNNHSGLHHHQGQHQHGQHQASQQQQQQQHHSQSHNNLSHPRGHSHAQSQSLSHQQPHPQSIIYSTPSHASTSSSVSPVASLHGHFSPAPHSLSLSPPYNSHSHSVSSANLKMEHDRDLLQDELAAQEVAARDYQPQLEGPLVGDKTQTTAITNEYAKADPIYIEKTMALPNTYSHYRPIQGDGNCGWRAIGFAYFETLIQLGDRNKIEGEVARIMSLNPVLISVGYDQFLFEDMVDETISLLRDIAASVDNHQEAMSVLTERFNNRERSSAIIYHLRLLTSAWMKGDPSSYEPFIPEDLGVAGYCDSVIERVDREIENVGISLLVNVLLAPVDLVLEIAYLDRSPGSQVNIYRFPDEANAQTTQAGHVIYLLYRPDHYDILYKPPVTVQVNRVAAFSHQHEIGPHREPDTYGSTDYNTLALLPNFTYAPTGLGSLGSAALASSMAGEFVPVATPSQWMQTAFTDAIPSHPAPRPASQVPRTVRPEVPPVHTRAAASAVTVSPPAAVPPPPPQAAQTPISQMTYPLRFSSQCYRLDNSTFPEPNFTTTTFKNSHYNKAHYNNPDFHPEEWTPDDDCGEKCFGGGGGGMKRKARHKHES